MIFVCLSGQPAIKNMTETRFFGLFQIRGIWTPDKVNHGLVQVLKIFILLESARKWPYISSAKSATAKIS